MSNMSKSQGLSLVALVLAVLSVVLVGYPLLTIAVILLALAHLV